jgi:hypothetical protein
MGGYGDDYDRKKRLRDRAHALTDPGAWRQAWFHLLGIELLSRSVPDGVDILEAASKVRVVRRRVIVHRDHRDQMKRCILSNGWDFAVTRIPPGAKLDQFGTVWGWSWHHPELPGTLVRPSNPLISDVVMLKAKHGLAGQDKRLATLSGARLNDEVIELAVPHDKPPKGKRRVPAWAIPPNFGLEPSGATWKPDDIDPPQLAGQQWMVGDDPDIAKPIKLEAYRCDAAARAMIWSVVTEKERLADLNARRRATLEAITGKTPIVTPMMSHFAADPALQVAALDMVADEYGFGIVDRRDRRNDLLDETTVKYLTRKRAGDKFVDLKVPKPYHPGKAADPGKRLTGEALIAAIARLSPEKKGWPHTKPYPRGDETGLFEKCRRAGRKQLQDYTSRPDLDEEYREWDLIRTSSAAGSADRHRLPRPMDYTAYDNFADRHWSSKRLIDVPEGWSRNSFAEELMSHRSKKPGWEWGNNLLFEQIFYSDRSLNKPGQLMPSPIKTEKPVPLHELFSREQPDCV